MHPAPSVIIFSVASGLGFGFLAFLGMGLVLPSGLVAFALWGLGYALAVGGLVSATFHLGNPQRALLAFTQWRSSWLSREAWASVAALVLLAPVALSDWLGLGWPRGVGMIGAALCLITVFCTAMIYAQLKTVPRWNHWTTPATFLGFCVAGGALLSGQSLFAGWALMILAVLLMAGFAEGDRRFAARGHSMASATGIGRIGTPQVFEQPHTGGNYLMREMIFIVARKHVEKLRIIAVSLAAIFPALLLFLPVNALTIAVAVAFHLIGAAVQRWLFFAEAEHVVGLYYGMR